MQAVVRAVSRRYNLAPAVIARARSVITRRAAIGRRGGRTVKCRRVFCDETWHEELDELVETGKGLESSVRLALHRNYLVCVMTCVGTIECYHYFNPLSYPSSVVKGHETAESYSSGHADEG
jgi:hypothetical protein